MFKTAVIRGLGFLLSEITLVGFVWILFDRKKQGIHDKFAHTMVIQTL
jgi:uncharacterized RDD family membrane protein YckC